MATAQDRRDEIEAWWALIARILAFFLGVLLLGYEAVLASADSTEVRVIVVFAAIAMMGPVIAASLASLLSASRSGSGPDE